MKVYLCGPYSHTTAGERVANVTQAREAMAELLKAGHTPICTFAMCEGMEHVDGLTYEMFMRLCYSWMNECEAMLMLPGFERSKGAKLEFDYVTDFLGIPVYYSLDDIPNALQEDT